MLQIRAPSVWDDVDKMWVEHASTFEVLAPKSAKRLVRMRLDLAWVRPHRGYVVASHQAVQPPRKAERYLRRSVA